MKAENPLDFTGLNVLVCGGSSGIGNAIARSFLDAGGAGGSLGFPSGAGGAP